MFKKMILASLMAIAALGSTAPASAGYRYWGAPRAYYGRPYYAPRAYYGRPYYGGYRGGYYGNPYYGGYVTPYGGAYFW